MYLFAWRRTGTGLFYSLGESRVGNTEYRDRNAESKGSSFQLETVLSDGREIIFATGDSLHSLKALTASAVLSIPCIKVFHCSCGAADLRDRELERPSHVHLVIGSVSVT